MWCASCGVVGRHLRPCVGCYRALYCSKECASSAWSDGSATAASHKSFCWAVRAVGWFVTIEPLPIVARHASDSLSETVCWGAFVAARDSSDRRGSWLVLSATAWRTHEPPDCAEVASFILRTAHQRRMGIGPFADPSGQGTGQPHVLVYDPLNVVDVDGELCDRLRSAWGVAPTASRFVCARSPPPAHVERVLVFLYNRCGSSGSGSGSSSGDEALFLREAKTAAAAAPEAWARLGKPQPANVCVPDERSVVELRLSAAATVREQPQMRSHLVLPLLVERRRELSVTEEHDYNANRTWAPDGGRTLPGVRPCAAAAFGGYTNSAGVELARGFCRASAQMRAQMPWARLQPEDVLRVSILTWGDKGLRLMGLADKYFVRFDGQRGRDYAMHLATDVRDLHPEMEMRGETPKYGGPGLGRLVVRLLAPSGTDAETLARATSLGLEIPDPLGLSYPNPLEEESKFEIELGQKLPRGSIARRPNAKQLLAMELCMHAVAKFFSGADARFPPMAAAAGGGGGSGEAAAFPRAEAAPHAVPLALDAATEAAASVDAGALLAASPYRAVVNHVACGESLVSALVELVGRARHVAERPLPPGGFLERGTGEEQAAEFADALRPFEYQNEAVALVRPTAQAGASREELCACVADALELDPFCVEARLLAAERVAATAGEAEALYAAAQAGTRARLEDTDPGAVAAALAAEKGAPRDLWCKPQCRALLRATKARALTLAALGALDRAAGELRTLRRLCDCDGAREREPWEDAYGLDPLGARDHLLPLLLRLGRWDEAETLLAADDGQGAASKDARVRARARAKNLADGIHRRAREKWAAAIIAFARRSPAADDALAEALNVQEGRTLGAYICLRIQVPDEGEKAELARGLVQAWHTQGGPAAIDWVRRGAELLGALAPGDSSSLIMPAEEERE